jgi:hypothetical protein
LQRLVALDAAYAAEGRPTTAAAKKWRDAHPEYDAMLARIADFLLHTLSSYRWGKTQSLADYCRRATVLESEGDLLLTRPLLVEGIPVAELTDPDGDDAVPASVRSEAVLIAPPPSYEL